MKTSAIDCDKDPFIPYDTWKVEKHIKGGKWKWVVPELYLSEKQKDGHILGTDLQKELDDKEVLNANVLDYLLAHPALIPEEWKGKYVLFWGTIYRHSDGSRYVRYLCWGGGRWLWVFSWLDDDWHDNFPAALRASPLTSDTKTSSNTLSSEKRIEALEHWKTGVQEGIKMLNEMK